MKMLQQKWFVITAIAFMLFLAGLVMSGTAFGAGGGQCEDNGDGTVTDNGTGLMWQKATAGEMRRMNWYDAMSYASGLSLGGHSGWRLPNRDELSGLYHSPCKNMMEVVSSLYWSSTTYDFNTNLAWLVNFNYGNVHCFYKSDSYSYVRAVRSAQ